MLRARGSLLAYQSALEQRNADVAIILLVTAIEALIAPRPSWGKAKVTKRFMQATQELCVDTVDALVKHDKVEEAFSIPLRGSDRKRRRELLDAIYAVRSLPTHAGLNPSIGNAMFHFGHSGGMRVALVSDLARDALLAYLTAP